MSSIIVRFEVLECFFLNITIFNLLMRLFFAMCVSLSTKVLDRVNKGLIRSIAFENCVYYSLMSLATPDPSITYYYCIKRLCVLILLPVESLL